MRKLIVAVATAGLLAIAGPALAGPQGTGDTEFGNNVSCGPTAPGSGGTKAPITELQVNTKGGALVVCNDGDELPVQGRIIATGGSGGGYVAADGDTDNDPNATGWARVDVGTGGVKVRCDNNTDGGQNSEQADSNGSGQVWCGK